MLVWHEQFLWFLLEPFFFKMQSKIGVRIIHRRVLYTGKYGKREGLDSSLFGIHSLCSGSASAAAALGVSDWLFQRHRGWRSVKARNNYVKESLDSLLLVSQSILQQ